MIDIDFRYVMRKGVIWEDDRPKGRVGMVKVLQWRKKVKSHIGSLEVSKWTEWQDVRTEEE